MDGPERLSAILCCLAETSPLSVNVWQKVTALYPPARLSLGGVSGHLDHHTACMAVVGAEHPAWVEQLRHFHAEDPAGNVDGL